MKQMLKKDGDGKYINPEAAAEANARITMGYLLWTAAITAAIYGKVTGGGSRDWKQNKEKENLTGWQPYSYKGKDGRYIAMNRLDPFFTPFAVAADVIEIRLSCSCANCKRFHFRTYHRDCGQPQLAPLPPRHKRVPGFPSEIRHLQHLCTSFCIGARWDTSRHDSLGGRQEIQFEI